MQKQNESFKKVFKMNFDQFLRPLIAETNFVGLVKTFSIRLNEFILLLPEDTDRQ